MSTDKSTWRKYYRARAIWFKNVSAKDINGYDKTGLNPKRPEGKPPKRKRRRKGKRKRAAARKSK